MSSLGSFIEAYGIFAVALGTFFEGETILLLGGLAAHRGYLTLPAVVGAGFAGTFFGDQLYFYIGRRHGKAFLEKRRGWEDRVARAQRILERYHVAFILGFRFLYGFRTVSPFVIGMSDVRARRYFLLNSLGGFVWTLAVTLLGYSVGEGAQALLGHAKEIELWLFVGLASMSAIVWAIVLLRRRMGH